MQTIICAIAKAAKVENERVFLSVQHGRAQLDDTYKIAAPSI
jgi:hypothetical protein